MTKEELVAKIATSTRHTKTATRNFLDAFVEEVKEALLDKDEILLKGLGKFSTTVRKERKGFNPKTQEEMIIPERTVPVFKFSQKFNKIDEY